MEMSNPPRTPNERWEAGIEHDPRSVEIFKSIADIDYNDNNDHWCWKSGGDGDNGENLMYLLDEHFQRKDEKGDLELGVVVQEVLLELGRARKKFQPFPSEHHGYAVLLEEVHELWEEVRSKDATPENVRAEAVQVAAMGIRFILDLCGPGDRKDAQNES
jgi:hypothetical protein